MIEFLYNTLAETCRILEILFLPGVFWCVIMISFSCKYFSFINKEFSFKILKSIFLIYGVVATLKLSLVPFANTEESVEMISFLNRATGYYWRSYVIIIGLNALSPFLFLINQISNKTWLFLLVPLLIHAGMAFERFVIIVTSFHRDGIDGFSMYFIYWMLAAIARGLILFAILSLINFLYKKLKNSKLSTK